MDWDDKADRLLDYFDSRKKFKMKGYACGHEVFGKTLRNNLEEWIEFAREHSSTHPSRQLDSKKDIMYFSCPECNEGTTFIPK